MCRDGAGDFAARRFDFEADVRLPARRIERAVGKRGLETVFDCGYTHAVAGYYSTGDYAAFSARALANAIKQNLRSGSILVMHFSDNSKYTAEALDLVLTEVENRGSKYQFVGLNKVLD